MSGELQSIPARHGTATFVPRGQTIKIINTYGKQVVDTWIFGLHDAPDQGQDEEEAEVMSQAEEESRKEEGQGEEKEGKKVSKSIEERSENDNETKNEAEVGEAKQDEDGDEEEENAQKKVTESVEEKPEPDEDDTTKEADGVEEKDTPSKDSTEDKNPKLSSSWSSYIPSTSSLPSFRRSQNASASKANAEPKEKRTWSSYFPSGVAYSSYLPSKQVLSGFASTHTRDPTKSYAEQLYDFSKTPVGAASLSVASGSGTASSLYAAYSAYTKLSHSRGDSPPMEYLSLAHTAAESGHLVPRVDDALLSNLRQPLATLVEDTSEAGHDALSPACDAAYYLARGGKGAEEHGSCAENLVLALKELNERAGLKGRRTVGADVSVYGAPGPWHLFQNGKIAVEESGPEIRVGEPKGVKRGSVRLRAERDIVVVMSACPDDMSDNNGGKCMAANFVVAEKEGDKVEANHKATASSPASKPKTPQPERKASTPPQPERKASTAPQPERKASSPRLERKESATSASSPRPPPSRRPSNPPRKLSQKPKQTPQQSDPLPTQQESQESEGVTQKADQSKGEPAQEEEKQIPEETKEEAPVVKKKPKKLQRRTDSTKNA